MEQSVQSNSQCALNCVDLLNRVDSYIDALKLHTVSRNGERHFVATYSNVVASEAFADLISALHAHDLEVRKAHGQEYGTNPHDPSLGPILFIPVGRPHWDATVAAAVAELDQLTAFVGVPDNRGVTRAPNPGSPRYRHGESVSNEHLERMIRAKRVLAGHVATSHARLAIDTRSSTREKPDGTLPPLTPNMRRIAIALLKLTPGEGIVRKELARKSGVAPGSLGRALRDLRKWGVRAGRRGAGYYIDSEVNVNRLRAAIATSK